MPNDLTIEELLHECLDSAELEAPTVPPGRTAECVPYQRLEAHAKRSRFLTAEEMRHVNRCPDYCQANLEAFRSHFRPFEPRFVAVTAQKLAAHEARGGSAVYNAAVEADNGQILGEANVVITDGPFVTSGRYLLFRLVITEPRFQPEMLPLRLSVSDVAEPGRIVFTFDLPTQANEIVKMRIPEHLMKHDRWKDLDETGRLPLSFVIQPIGNSDLLSLA